MSVQGLPGGGIFALTTTAAAFDLSALAGYDVLMSCDEAQLEFSFTANASTDTALVTTATAASTTVLVADQAGAGVKVLRQVMVKNARLVARVASGTGTLVVKPARKL